MVENLPPTENNKVTRKEVINAFHKFVEEGITNPDDLDLTNPGVCIANELLEKWQEQVDCEAKGDPELELRANLEKTMIFVDAGFSDPDYLDEVLEDWLVQDLQNVPKVKDDLKREETRKQIAEAILKIRRLRSSG